MELLIWRLPNLTLTHYMYISRRKLPYMNCTKQGGENNSGNKTIKGKWHTLQGEY